VHTYHNSTLSGSAVHTYQNSTLSGSAVQRTITLPWVEV